MLPTSGMPLEARLQRLFIALGFHTERGLVVRTGRGHKKKTATDIDVYVQGYSSNFHRSVFHVECKGEKNVKTLDRSLWLVGIRKLLNADRSILFVPRYDPESLAFARELGIEILSLETLCAMENAYNISEDWWPGRSNYKVWDIIQIELSKFDYSSQLVANAIKTLNYICIEEGWRKFSFGYLNKLLRLLKDANKTINSNTNDIGLVQIARFFFSSALVRLSHCLLSICEDIITRQPLDRSTYIAERLTVGDQDIEYTKNIIEASNRMIQAVLSENNLRTPDRWNPTNLLQVPRYHSAFMEVLNRFVDQPEQSMYLPYSTELIQFGYNSEPREFVDKCVNAGKPSLEMLKALLIQQFSISKQFLDPPDPDIILSYIKGNSTKKTSPSDYYKKRIQEELPLDFSTDKA